MNILLPLSQDSLSTGLQHLERGIPDGNVIDVCDDQPILPD
jgi:hypothetical protein